MAKNSASKYGAALADQVNEMRGKVNTGDMTMNSTNPPEAAGGITVAIDLLPDVAEGDTVTLTVQKVDTVKGEVHLVRENTTPTTPTEVIPT